MSYKVGSSWTVTARYVDVFTYDTFIVKPDKKKKCTHIIVQWVAVSTSLWSVNA